MWTYDTDDGLVDYVYWNGLVDRDKPRLTVNSTVASGIHSLIVSGIQLNDSGLYDCYTNSGLRIVGYQIIVNGMYYLGSCMPYYSQTGNFYRLH